MTFYARISVCVSCWAKQGQKTTLLTYANLSLRIAGGVSGDLPVSEIRTPAIGGSAFYAIGEVRGALLLPVDITMRNIAYFTLKGACLLRSMGCSTLGTRRKNSRYHGSGALGDRFPCYDKEGASHIGTKRKSPGAHMVGASTERDRRNSSALANSTGRSLWVTQYRAESCSAILKRSIKLGRALPLKNPMR